MDERILVEVYVPAVLQGMEVLLPAQAKLGVVHCFVSRLLETAWNLEKGSLRMLYGIWSSRTACRISHCVLRMPAFATQNASSSYRRNEMSIKIQVDPARLDSAAGQIEQQTLSYEKNYRRLFQEVAAMGSGWQGKDNQAFVSQIQGFEKDFQQMAALMREYAAFLKLSAKTYRQTQDERAQMARRLVN